MKRNEIARFPQSVGTSTVEKYSRQANGNETFHKATGMGNGFEEDANFMATAGAGTSQEPYIVIATNASTTLTRTAVIFGQFKYGNVGRFGSDVDVTVSLGVPTATYSQLLSQSAVEPFEIVLTRVVCTDANQLQTSLSLNASDPSGETKTRSITVGSYESPDQYSTTKIDVKQNYRIDGTTWLTYSMLPSTSVTFYFYVAAKINVASTLNGGAPIKDFSVQRVRTFLD